MNEDGASGLVAPNDDVTQRLREGVLRLSNHGGDGYLTNVTPITVRRDEIGDIIIRARATKRTRLTLAWSKEANPENPFENRFDLVARSERQAAELRHQRARHSATAPGTGRCGSPYLSPPLRRADADLEIDYIRFISKMARFLSAINGVVHEELGGEMRRAIYMLTDQTLLWSVDVPEQTPRLDLGQGLLEDDEPVRFSVTIEHGGVDQRRA